MTALPDQSVIFEDNHLIVVSKEAGELVQGDITGDLPLLEKVREYIRKKYNKPGNVYCGLVHRLDRPTSGIVVFAKTGKALARMNKIFHDREVDKTYFALTKIPLKPEKGKLQHHLKKNPKTNKSSAVKPGVKDAKEALLEYEMVGKSDNYFLYRIKLFTGRHHQIRAQFAAAGSPIKGDLKYGFPRSNPDGSISLHAGEIAFTHPVSKENLNFKLRFLGSDKAWAHFNRQFYSV